MNAFEREGSRKIILHPFIIKSSGIESALYESEMNDDRPGRGDDQ